MSEPGQISTCRRRATIAAIAAGAAIAVLVAWLALSPAKRHAHPAHADAQQVPATLPTGPGPQAQPPPTGRMQIGVSVNRLFNDRLYSPPEIEAQLAAIAATGVRTVRSDALWELAEPAAPPAGAGTARYDWSFDDAIAASLRRHHLTWLPIVDYTPAWASSRPDLQHALPRTAGAFASFAQALALRYKAPAYEIWNEPDDATFAGPRPDPVHYGAIYEAARAAILAVQPAARVLVGGLTHPALFLPAMIHAHPELLGHIDGIAIHPYRTDAAAVLRAVVRSRSVLASVGLAATPLYVTEVGWTTSPPGALSYAPASARPGYISRALAGIAASGCGVAAVYLYTWITPQKDPRDSQDWFGISSSRGDVAALAQAVVAPDAASPSAEGLARCPR